MTSALQPSAACCSTPAIIGPPYTPQGEFIEVDRTKVYVAGAENATQAIFVMYDIFGYSGQILRGVDKLARHYCVFMPAFFGDEPAPLSYMPMDGPEDMEKLTEFCEGPGDTEKALRRMEELRQKLQTMQPQIEKWALLGYCWGGFVANYAIGKETPFSACAICHPGLPGVDIASAVSIPLLAVCSKDEPETEFEDFKHALRVEHRFELFPKQVHGFMSARADLTNSEVQAGFDTGYGMVLDWFQKHV